MLILWFVSTNEIAITPHYGSINVLMHDWVMMMLLERCLSWVSDAETVVMDDISRDRTRPVKSSTKITEPGAQWLWFCYYSAAFFGAGGLGGSTNQWLHFLRLSLLFLLSFAAPEALRNAQVIELPIVDSLHPRPPYMPQAFPEDLAPRLMRLHGNPSAWFIGQFLKYLLKPQPGFSEEIEDARQSLGFKTPIVGYVLN